MRDSVLVFDSHADEFTAWLKRINNSDDAPCFGKMYHIIATDNKTHKGYVAYADRFLSDEKARVFFDEYIKTHHDEIVACISSIS